MFRPTTPWPRRLVLAAALTLVSTGLLSCAGARGTVDGQAGTDGLLAVLVAYPAATEAGSGIVLDASGSGPNDGSLVYDYDVDDDGGYDYRDAASFIEHTYAAAGSYTARVRVTNGAGLSDTTTTTVTVTAVSGDGTGDGTAEVGDPAVELGYWPSSLSAGDEANLDASNSWSRDGSDLQYEFDFDGDGNYDLTTAEYAVTHTYDAAGTYQATVRVTDGGGRWSTATVTITVSTAAGTTGTGGEEEEATSTGQPPVVVISADPAHGTAPVTITFSTEFSLDIDGGIVSFDWDLDNDGTFEVLNGGPAQSVEFSAAGTYQVNVRATDDDGNTATGLGLVYLD